MGTPKQYRFYQFICLVLILLALEGTYNISAEDRSPVPALTPTIASQKTILPRIQELMIDNGECTLPCFWGFQPEEATSAEIDQLLASLGAEINLYQVDGQTGHNSDWFFHPDGLLMLGFSISDHSHRLNQTSIILTDPHVWLPKSVLELSEVLKSLGLPTDVFVLIAGPPLRYSLLVLYNDQGVMIRYDIDIEYDPFNIDVDAPLRICPSTQETKSIYAWLQNPDSEAPVEENQPDLREADRPTRTFWPLYRMTGMTVEEFTEFFLENPDGCIEAPSLAALQEKGYQY